MAWRNKKQRQIDVASTFSLTFKTNIHRVQRRDIQLLNDIQLLKFLQSHDEYSLNFSWGRNTLRTDCP
jgi:hypothetical protein